MTHKLVPRVRRAVEIEYGEDDDAFDENAAELVAKFLELMHYGDDDLTDAKLLHKENTTCGYIYQAYIYSKYILGEGWVTITDEESVKDHEGI